MSRVRAPIRSVISLLGLAAFRVRVSYSQHARTAIAAGNTIVHANHVSLLDGVIVALASPAPLVFAVDTDFSRRSPIARFGFNVLSRIGFGTVVPLDRSAPFGMRALKRALLSGANVMVFPEGGISVSGDRQPDKPGLSWLVAKTGASLVEVTIAGAEKSRLFARSGSEWGPKIFLTF
jgi:1-acyl-sn-glycerol-3-phosphate acyltransferase